MSARLLHRTIGAARPSTAVLSRAAATDPSGRRHPEIDLSFENTKEAFKSKSTFELLRGLLVLKMCTFDTLVKHNLSLAQRARQVLGKRLFEMAMKMTFYGHFVAGNTQNEIKPVISKMRQYGVKSILDYSVEKDMAEESGVVDAEKLVSAEEQKAAVEEKVEAIVSSAIGQEAVKEARDTSKQYSGYAELWDRREGVSSARTFFYAGEPECDNNAKVFIDSVDAAAEATEGTGFVAVKLTALGRPTFLLTLSEVIMRSHQFYRALTQSSWETLVRQKIDRGTFVDKVKQFGVQTDSGSVKKWFDSLDFDDDGFVDLYDWSRVLDSSFKLGEIFKVLNLRTGQMEPLIKPLNETEEMQFQSFMRRLRDIVEHAQKRNVRVMIDAEQTYFQPAISRLVLEMQRMYNKEEPVVFNTYQAYLRRCSDSVRIDMHLAERENFHFGCKLVRGAYMEQERKRAKFIGYNDPINPNFEATTDMYKTVLSLILDEWQKRPGKVSVMCATHNEDSVRFTVQEMRNRNIHPEDKVVCFGQLYGMCDQVSFSLGQAGYSVYKYVPYGPVEEVLPYLSRRAIENSGFIKKATKERRLMAEEVRRRMNPFSGMSPPTPRTATAT